MMEYLSDLKCKVIYPKGQRVDRKTLFNLKIYALEEKLLNKVSNEFKHCLINYNPYNFMDSILSDRYCLYLDDHNNYDCFKGAKNE